MTFRQPISRRSLVRIVALAAPLALGCALAAGAAAADRHGRLYRAGRMAHLAGNHRNAVLLLLDAIQYRSTEGEPWVRLYGRYRAPYLPYYYLGASLFELGELERARAAFDESVRQGAVLAAEEAKPLAEYRRRLVEEAVPALRDETVGELDQLRSLLDRLDETLAAAPGPSEPTAVRGRASAAIASAEQLTSHPAPPGPEEIPRWRQAATRLSEAAGEVSRAILAAESGRDVAADPTAGNAGRLDLEQRWRELRVHRSGGACESSALEQLEHFVAELEPERPGATELRPRLVLAATLLECGEPERAAASLAMAEARSEGAAGERQELGERIAAAASERRERRERLLAEIETVLARERDRPCAPAELDDLARRLAELAVASPSGGSGEATSTLRARILRHCHDLAGAEAEIAETRRRREQELDRRRLLEDLAAAGAAGDLGVCDAERLARLDRLFGDPHRAEVADWVVRTAALERDAALVLLAGHRACGDAEAVRRALSLAGSADASARPELREAERWLLEREFGALYAGRHALLVGAASYAGARGGWWNLSGVRADVEELSDFLSAIGFDSVEVVAPPVTGARIRDAVAGFVARHGTPAGGAGENLLLLYFAGHGETLAARLDDPEGGYEFKSGYFVPEDAPRPDDDAATRERFLELAIGMDEVERWARSIGTRHALFLFDTCFAGTVFRALSRGRGLVMVPEERTEPGRLPPLVVARAASPVRLFATAGTENQVVPDDSVFRRLLLEALSGRRRDADYTRDGFLLGREICLFLEDQVALETASRQTPQCGTMPPPFDEGDVVFRLPGSGAPAPEREAARARLRADLEAWSRLRARPNGLAEYLDEHPRGRFAPLSRYLALHGETSLAVRGDATQPGS